MLRYCRHFFLFAWQASLGVPEDGIVTAELLERLFENSGSGIAKEDKATNLEKVCSIA